MGPLVNFKIELTASDIALIGSLLDEQPYKRVVDLVRRVQAQINEQEQAALAPAPSETPVSAAPAQTEAPIESNEEAAQAA